MGCPNPPLRVDAAFEAIEGTILPGLTAMLEGLCEAASAGPDQRATNLAAIAAELDALTRQIQAIDGPAYASAQSRRISA